MAKSQLPQTWDVPLIFRQRLGDAVGRQRLMKADGHLLLVLHKPPSGGASLRIGRYFWKSPEGVWQGHEPGGRSITLANHLAEYGEAIDQLDKLEGQASTASQFFDLMSELEPLRRATRNLHRVLQEAREAAPEDRDLLNFRDRAYELERSAELTYGDVKNGLDFAMAKQAEAQAASSHRMAVSAHRLNLLAAFFFPLATISAVLGANVQHGWEGIPPPVPFFVMLATGFVGGALLAGFVSATRK